MSLYNINLLTAQKTIKEITTTEVNLNQQVFFCAPEAQIVFIDFDMVNSEIQKINTSFTQYDVKDLSKHSLFEIDLTNFVSGIYTITVITKNNPLMQQQILVTEKNLSLYL